MAKQLDPALKNVPKTSAVLKVAWFLGAAPLVVGVLIFLLWVLLRADIFMALGIAVILAGFVCIFLGAICLAIYMWRSSSSKDIPYKYVMRNVAALAGLYLANFLVAGGLACSAIAIDTCYCVSVSNKSPLTLTSAGIYGGGQDILLPDIPPGSTVRKFFWIKRDGTLMFEAMCGNDRVSVIVDEYTTNDMGGNKAVTVDASNKVTVLDKRPGRLD